MGIFDRKYSDLRVIGDSIRILTWRFIPKNFALLLITSIGLSILVFILLNLVLTLLWSSRYTTTYRLHHENDIHMICNNWITYFHIIISYFVRSLVLLPSQLIIILSFQAASQNKKSNLDLLFLGKLKIMAIFISCILVALIYYSHIIAIDTDIGDLISTSIIAGLLLAASFSIMKYYPDILLYLGRLFFILFILFWIGLNIYIPMRIYTLPITYINSTYYDSSTFYLLAYPLSWLIAPALYILYIEKKAVDGILVRALYDEEK